MKKKMPDINFKYSSILFLFIKREKKKELKRNANLKSLKVIISYIDFQEIWMFRKLYPGQIDRGRGNRFQKARKHLVPTKIASRLLRQPLYLLKNIQDWTDLYTLHFRIHRVSIQIPLF